MCLGIAVIPSVNASSTVCSTEGTSATQLSRNLEEMIAERGLEVDHSTIQGIAKIHELSETPIRKSPEEKLTKKQKKSNRELNRLRIIIEHVNRSLKIFKILSDSYRNRHRKFGLKINLIAGIYNRELVL